MIKKYLSCILIKLCLKINYINMIVCVIVSIISDISMNSIIAIAQGIYALKYIILILKMN